MRMADLKPGWAVVGNDGKHVGAVEQVGQNYVLTSIDGPGGDIYVPASAIANVEHDMIHLSMPQHDVAQMGWGNRRGTTTSQPRHLRRTSTGMSDPTRRVLRVAGCGETARVRDPH